MGVKYLWSILEPACKQGSYDDLAGKTAAVDLSIWIIECRSVPTTIHRNSLHLRYSFSVSKNVFNCGSNKTRLSQ
jgi:hypothetical protein